MTSVESHDSVDPLRAEWRSWPSARAQTPFLHPGWIDAWWRAFGKGRLTVMAARDGDELVAVMPLARRRGRLISPTNWHTPVFGPVCANGEARSALADALLREAGTHLRLRFIDAGDPVLDPSGHPPTWADTGS